MKPGTLTVYFIILALLLAACGPAPAPTTPPPPDPPATANPTPADAGSTDTVSGQPAGDSPPPDSGPTAAGSASLFDAFTAPITAQGEVIFVTGRVLDVNGNPVTGAAVEFWQTDASGVYDHPGDSGTARRDLNFQFYGTSITGQDGTYIFRTIRPARYGNRPPHIHFKVKLNGATLLTSQFYFADSADANAQDSLSAGVGAAQLLVLEAVEGVDAPVATIDIVVDTGIGVGKLPLTPAQGEGPYYPVANVADFDNDLVSVGN